MPLNSFNSYEFSFPLTDMIRSPDTKILVNSLADILKNNVSLSLADFTCRANEVAEAVIHINSRIIFLMLLYFQFLRIDYKLICENSNILCI